MRFPESGSGGGTIHSGPSKQHKEFWETQRDLEGQGDSYKTEGNPRK